MKNNLQILQKSNKLSVSIGLSEEYAINKIIWRNPTTLVKKFYSVKKIDDKYVFDVEYSEFMTELQKEQADFLIDEDENKDFKNEWFWYAEVEVKEDQASDSLLDKLEEKAVLREEADLASDWIREGNSYKKNLRLGKFKDTDIQGLNMVEKNGQTVLTYLNSHGYLVTAVNEKVTGKVKLQVEELKVKKNSIEYKGKVNTGYFPITDCKAVLKSRTTPCEHKLNIVMHRNEEVFRKKYGKNIYQFSGRIEFDGLLEHDNDIYDFYIEADIAYYPEPVRIRVGRPTFRAKHFLKEIAVKNGDSVLLINPYYTLYKSNLSFEVFPFVAENYKYLKKARKFSRMKQWLNRKKDIWLVGERPYKAQDTGFHFFKYMREHHPEKNVYYVMSKDSPEFKNVEPLGNVLEFGSKEHIWNVITATKIFSSHHTNYLFPIRTKSFEKIVRATRIFLQHGVMGVKNMTNLYGVNSKAFKTDLFVTSSEYEKGYIASDFGYKEEDILVAGLPRFDSLFKKDVAVKRQVVIIPTWRDWIQDIDSFLESEYYERYLNLINNEELQEHSKLNNYELIFCLHPNMQVFSSYFKDAPVKIIYQGDVDVQVLIKESALLVTDYSSVAFDFSFLHKPVLYYQFDRPRFIGKKGSHINLLEDLPGEIFEEEEQLIQGIQKYVNNNFEMERNYIEKANKFIKFRDQGSSNRIYEAALVYEKKSTFIERLDSNEMLGDLYKKVRKSKYYFPVIKRAYFIMKTILPINENKIFFESGIGKNFADSPKEIFEVLQKEGRDFQYIWSYNKALNQNYKNTKVVRRLSPLYYYHLATSKYWINNQNFPTYIKKRKGTKYLQTWHGTPLKRMLYDVEEIQGRDETYLNRVSKAIGNWDYLLSPSTYATKNFRSAFQYSGPILEEGYPRNDIFYQENAKTKATELRERLNIDPGKKILLYAMTFRDNQTQGKNFTLDIPIDFQKFHERLGDEYVLLIRLHVIVSKKLKIPSEYSDSIINVSAYPDVQELMLISDALITDYSSVFFDYLNTDKPILFYTYDLEEYRDKLRGFYMDFESEAPGPLCLNEDSLYEAVLNLSDTEKEYRDKYQTSKEKYCYLDDGKASVRIVQKFFG